MLPHAAQLWPRRVPSVACSIGEDRPALGCARGRVTWMESMSRSDPSAHRPQARMRSRGDVLMYDAPAFGTAVPDECAAPTTQHIAIRAAPEDRERADGDFTEAVDADLLWSHSRLRRKRSEHRFLLVLGRREAEQLPARLAGP